MHATAHLGSDQRSVSRNVCTSVGAVGRTAHRHRERPCRLPLVGLVRRSDLLLLLPQKDSKTVRREWGPVAGSDFCGTLRHAAERSFPFSYTIIIAGPHRSPRSNQHSPCVWGRWQSHASLSIGVGSEGTSAERALCSRRRRVSSDPTCADQCRPCGRRFYARRLVRERLYSRVDS